MHIGEILLVQVEAVHAHQTENSFAAVGGLTEHRSSTMFTMFTVHYYSLVYVLDGVGELTLHFCSLKCVRKG